MSRTSLRRFLTRSLAVSVVAAGLVPLSAGASWACSCVHPVPSETERYSAVAAQESTIYVAHVVAERLVSTPEGFDQREYDVVVSNSLKGGARGTRTLTSTTTSCAMWLDPSRPVLVTTEQIAQCGTTTQERVAEREAIVEAALHRAPTTYVTAPGDSVRSVARDQLRAQLGAAPSEAYVDSATLVLHRANRKALGPRRGPLPAGTRLVVPRLT